MAYNYDHATRQVDLWVNNDGDHCSTARNAVKLGGVAELRGYCTRVIKGAQPYTAPWHVAQELAEDDYDRVDWVAIAESLSVE